VLGFEVWGLGSGVWDLGSEVWGQGFKVQGLGSRDLGLWFRVPRSGCPRNSPVFISDKAFLKSYCRSQLPHESVNLSFTVANIRNNFTNLCGN
jgi:hypothetical protein